MKDADTDRGLGSELTLSRAAQALWGKTDFGADRYWLPLYVHLYDSFRVAGRLWEAWVPESTKRAIARGLGANAHLARQLVLFMAAVHDIGKATPAFQATPIYSSESHAPTCFIWKDERAGLPFEGGIHTLHAPKHTVAGQAVLARVLEEDFGIPRHVSRPLTSVIGCHHGTPSDFGKVNEAWGAKAADLGLTSEPWCSAQRELVGFACELSGISLDELKSLFSSYVPPSTTSVLLGLVIMTDWIASDQDLFKLMPVQASVEGPRFTRGEVLDLDGLDRRFEGAWAQLDLLPCWREDSEAARQWKSLYATRFEFPDGAKPRPVQEAALRLAATVRDPGLMIIEAPMGEGKTEAALAAAEVLGSRCGSGGVCIALPTMATTDAMFARVHAWLRHLPQPEGEQTGSIYLAHGKAQLNEEFMGIARAGSYNAIGQDLEGESEDTRAYVSDWMYGRKRGMLANFVVCTVDQVLMGALQMKHLALRQLALANKVVIIDECHAYDSYMQEYLAVILEWLGSWHAPVILLSATLPANQREQMAQAYLRGRGAPDLQLTVGASGESTESQPASGAGVSSILQRLRKRPSGSRTQANTRLIDPTSEDAYPLITYTEGHELRSQAVPASGRETSVSLQLVPDDQDTLVTLLADKLSKGGCAGVVCDTVGRAQEAYDALVARFGQAHVLLTHSRFTDIDRMQNEKAIRETLGPQATRENGERPELLIVVGTQVLEQSLDIDFDLLVSDVAPVDLLFQRLGRVHRHNRGRRPGPVAEPVCCVRGVEAWEDMVPWFVRGVRAVYEEAFLLEALAALGLDGEGSESRVTLPADIARLVRKAYGPDAGSDLPIPPAWDEHYTEACAKRSQVAERKRTRAHACLLQSEEYMCKNRSTLTGWYSSRKMLVESGSVRDDDRGPRAVRDTQETVEVMALRLRHGKVYLLPWIGDVRHGVRPGAVVPTDGIPPARVAKAAVQSTLRLPLAVCPPNKIDDLIDELERMDEPYAGWWQESPWLEGQLALLLEEDEDGRLSADVLGWRLAYSRELGLTVDRLSRAV